MADDPLAPALERIRHRARNFGDSSDVTVLLKAVDAVLAGHPLTATVRYAVPCDAHAYTAIGARRDCPRCVKTEYRDGCQECRDEFGNPVRPGDCRARKAILAGLTGKGPGGG